MRHVLFGLMIAIASVVPSAHAQVFKCTGPEGKPTFSDRPCDANSAGGMIQRERTFEEKMSEREQAYEAQMRKQDRRMAEQEREWSTQSQRAAQPIAAPVVRHSGNDWQKRKDLENAATAAGSISNNGSRWDRAAEAQREEARREDAKRRAAARTTFNITNCNGGFCYDDGGNVYTRSGGFINRTDGRNCTVAGNLVQCN